jgi:hypothetical protein
MEDPMRRLFLSAAIAVLLMGPAMAIDFDQPLKSPDGQVMKNDKGQSATLGQICESALVSQYKDEVNPQTGVETITPEEKYRRWKLAGKVHGKHVDLSPEDLTLLKKLVGKAYGPAIVGPAWQALDPSLESK